MSNSNTGLSLSGSKSNVQHGSKSGFEHESKNQDGAKGGRSSQSAHV